MISPVNDAAVEVAELLLAAPDTAARAALLSAALVNVLPDSACAIHRFTLTEEGASWTAIGLAGDIAVADASIPPGSPLVGPLLEDPPEAVIYSSSDLRREDYSHLHVNRSVASLAYVPLLLDGELTGAVEILTFDSVLEFDQFEELQPIFRLIPPAIRAAENNEEQRQTLLDSVHRMSQLYDLEKSLNSTLEMDAVTAMVPVKAMAMLPCQAIHLWLFDGSVLRLMATYGADETVAVGITEAPGEGYVADMAEEGEPLLIDDADDERLTKRNSVYEGPSDVPPVMNALLVPLMQDEAEVGVLEAINRDGHPFDDDDMFFLSSMAETVSGALKNASLMLSERKLEILEALVRVSSEITSTLRLDRLLQIIVNSPQNVLPYEVSAIALDNRGRLQLKAISGMASLPMGDAQVDRLQDLIRWLSSQEGALRLSLHEDEPDPEMPSAVTQYFEQTGYRGLFSLPLADDQGRVGLLLYASSQPDFLDLPHTEMIKILAGQATVAIRNALLYREVPLISLIEPLVQKRAALMRTSKSRAVTLALVAAAIVLLLILVPLPLRISGEATVAPQHLVTIAAPVDGNVEAVFAHEGQRVAAGDTLGALSDWQWRTDLAASEAKYQQATLTMEDDLAHGRAQAGADRAQAEFLRTEMARDRTRFDNAKLRTTVAGIVVTPNLQNIAGKHLDAGATFAQVLDLDSAVIQIAIPERDAGLLASGQMAAVKLDSYPQRTWRSSVSAVSPQAQPGDGDRLFTAEVTVPNSDATLRAGMSGKAKIFIGWRSAGYVLLRRPALGIWQTLWNWIGW
jgi:transcriptional regulator with GAF, ATPase, and Fis domain/multidrug resistance efflux pump